MLFPHPQKKVLLCTGRGEASSTLGTQDMFCVRLNIYINIYIYCDVCIDIYIYTLFLLFVLAHSTVTSLSPCMYLKKNANI